MGRTGSYSSSTGRYADRYDDRDRERDRDRDRDRDRMSSAGGQSAARPDRNSSASWSAPPPGPQTAERDALWPMFRAVDKDSKYFHAVLVFCLS